MEFLNEKHEWSGLILAVYGAVASPLGYDFSWQQVSIIIGGVALYLGYRYLKAGPFEIRNTRDE